jgi:hypothetical protein
MLRIPQCLDSRLTDGGEVVSLRHLDEKQAQNKRREDGSGNEMKALSELV